MISSGVRETIKYLLKNNMVGKKGFGVISTFIQHSYFIGEFTRSLAIYRRYFMYSFMYNFPSIEQQMKKKKWKVELNTMSKKKGLGSYNISCFEHQDPSSPSCIFHIFVVMEGMHLSGRLYCYNSWRYWRRPYEMHGPLIFGWFFIAWCWTAQERNQQNWQLNCTKQQLLQVWRMDLANLGQTTGGAEYPGIVNYFCSIFLLSKSLSILVITKGYRVQATTIEGQNAFASSLYFT